MPIPTGQILGGGGPFINQDTGLPYRSPFTGMTVGGFGARLGEAVQLDPNNPNHQRIEQALAASRNAGVGMFDAARAAWPILRPGEPFPTIPHTANALLQQSIGQLLQGQQVSPTPAATATTTQLSTPTATPTSPVVNLFRQPQSASESVGRLTAGPSEIRGTQPQQVSPLMQLFNFPRLRTKKPAQYGGGTMPGGVGQYNENFWNAWRL